MRHFMHAMHTKAGTHGPIVRHTTCIHAQRFPAETLSTSDALLHHDTFTRSHTLRTSHMDATRYVTQTHILCETLPAHVIWGHCE